MNKELESKINVHILRRIITAIYCVGIFATIIVVMVKYYMPNLNSPQALGSVYMDIICLMVLILLILSFVFDNYGLYKTTRLFVGLLIASTWALILDFLNWAFDGVLSMSNLTFWFTLGSICMASVLAGFFCMYLFSYMEENHRLSKIRKYAVGCAILNATSCAVTFVLGVSGDAFTFVDGHYEIGSMYEVVEAIPILSLIFMTGVVIRYIKKIGLRDVLVVVGYILSMLSGALIEASYRIGTTYVGVALADVLIYVMLQNDVIVQEKRNVQKWMAKSNTDVLTGFYNRHAYESDIIKYESDIPDDDFVYVSMDVNSLKSVNDTYGHGAGDELLIGASECIEATFGDYGKLYRIGGDEFVALINVDEETLKNLKKNMEATTHAWSGNLVKDLTISCGYVNKKETEGMSIKQMAVLADRRMYDAKARHYRRLG